jgi:hypothetical protein
MVKLTFSDITSIIGYTIMYILLGIIPSSFGVNLFFTDEIIFGEINVVGRGKVYSLILQFLEKYVGNWFIGIFFILFGFWMTTIALENIFETNYFLRKNYEVTKKVKIINAFVLLMFTFFILFFKNKLLESFFSLIF